MPIYNKLYLEFYLTLHLFLVKGKAIENRYYVLFLHS